MIIFTVQIKDTEEVIQLPYNRVFFEKREYKIIGAHVRYCECKSACFHVRNYNERMQTICCRCLGTRLK